MCMNTVPGVSCHLHPRGDPYSTPAPLLCPLSWGGHAQNVTPVQKFPGAAHKCSLEFGRPPAADPIAGPAVVMPPAPPPGHRAWL